MGLFHSATMAPKAAPPKVPESVLKKRKTLEKIKADRAEKALAIKKASKVSRKAIFKKAEAYVKEYKNMEKALINSRRQAKQFGNYFVEPEPKLLSCRASAVSTRCPRSRARSWTFFVSGRSTTVCSSRTT